jgi:hypothetical protein
MLEEGGIRDGEEKGGEGREKGGIREEGGGRDVPIIVNKNLEREQVLTKGGVEIFLNLKHDLVWKREDISNPTCIQR